MPKGQIYHVFIKGSGKNLFMTALTRLYENVAYEEVGKPINSLQKHDFNQPFENDKCIIWRGNLIRYKRISKK